MMQSDNQHNNAPEQRTPLPESTTPPIKASSIIRYLEIFLIAVILGLSGVLIQLLVDIRQQMLALPTQHRQLQQSTPDHILNATAANTTGVKTILYVVTSSSEFNSMKRGMQHHDRDRLMTVVVPVMKESIESMMAAGYLVDLYMIVSYNITGEREEQVREALPEGVNLEVWNNACPMDYDKKPNQIMEVSRSLSRQHRYVVRDKLFDYDLHVCFEDDMLVTGTQINHYLEWSRMIDEWRAQAPFEAPNKIHGIDHRETFFGLLTKKQLARIRPGFIRVEALLNATLFVTQESLENVPLDHNFSDYGPATRSDIDPSICCHVTHIGSNGKSAPKDPDPGQLMMWEAGVAGMSVREMPDGTWVGMMSGPRQFPGHVYDYKVGKYYSGSEHKLRDKPITSNPKFLAQSAGWMMTQRQLVELHDGICMGSFLPPFDDPTFQRDGLYMNNVEYWSGGLQMWCPRNGCNIQRILSLDPTNFSKHLLYHTSNNKQKQIKQERRVRANDLLGQLNHVRKDAMQKKEKILASQS